MDYFWPFTVKVGKWFYDFAVPLNSYRDHKLCFCLNTLSQFFHVFQIEGVDPDNARVMVKLTIGGKTVTISQYAVKLVFRKEYEKYSKDLSK